MKKIVLAELIIVIGLVIAAIFLITGKKNIEVKKEVAEVKKEIKEEIKEVKPVTTEVKGNLFEVYGFVFINNQKAKPGDVVKEGDIIKTSPYSYTTIKFNNKSIFRVNPKSQFLIEKLIIDEKTPFSVKVISGGVLSLFRQKGDYKVNSEISVIGVRGTTFFTYVDSNNNNHTDVCACHGEIDFASHDHKHSKQIKSTGCFVYGLRETGFIDDNKLLAKEIENSHNLEEVQYLDKKVNSDEKYLENSEPDYSLSSNNKLLFEAVELIKQNKGKNAIAKLSTIAKTDAYASYLVGKILKEGIGMPKNEKEAEKWFVKAKKMDFPLE